jgi:archaemetzincin
MKFSPEQLLSVLAPDARPLRSPAPNDWPSRHPNETRQTFAVVSKPRNRDIHADSSLTLYPTPEIASDYPDSLDCLKSFLGAYFQFPVVGWHTLPLHGIGFQDRRDAQIRTTALLGQLPSHRKGEKRLVLTSHDLFPNEDQYNFVFGEADYSYARAIVSLFRYEIPRFAPLAGLPLIRLLKITSHEIGHLFALEHCVAYLCNMNGVNHTAEVDQHPLDLSPEYLAKWAWLSNPDVARRLADLHSFYARHNLDSERESISHRIALLNSAGTAYPLRKMSSVARECG